MRFDGNEAEKLEWLNTIFAVVMSILATFILSKTLSVSPLHDAKRISQSHF